MLLRTHARHLPSQATSSRQAARVAHTSLAHGLFMALCMAALALGASPVGAQENNPEESGIIYEDVNPGGGTENNPEESDIVYEDFPLDGLPEGGTGNTPLPIGEQPPGAIPEPTTLALLLTGAAGAMLLGRRRARRY